MNFDADVIVVGAGPAGSLAAYMLASSGLHVIVLEKNLFPRYKVCGGGLTHKILNEIPFDLSPVIERTIHSFRFSHNYGHVFTRQTADPLMYCTMRGDLDSFFLQKAINAGSIVRMGEQLTSFFQDASGVNVTTKTKSYHTRLLIGAEGASGVIARTSGLRDKVEMGLAWEAEVTAGLEDIMRFSETVFLDWGTLPGGYAWVFPKRDHFSIGVGGPASLSKAMMTYYDRFVKSISREIDDPSGNGICFLETLSKASWPIPVRTKKGLFHHGCVLITGDEAGLGDPLTGEGIYYAVRSGIIAAETCVDFLSGRINSLTHYSEKVNDELMSELLEANNIKHVFNAAPFKIHSLVEQNNHAWKAFGKILRGERWYADVRKGFGKWMHFWNLVCFICGMIESYKEKKFLKQIATIHK
jgi:geranylgeranyl reductase family protein